MNKGLINSQFLNILLLTFLAGFLVFPKICLANNLPEITPEEIEKYLEMPEKDDLYYPFLSSVKWKLGGSGKNQ